MLNYLKSEFYRVLYNKSTYFFVAVCSLLLLSSNLVLAAVKSADEAFPYANTAFSIVNLASNFGFVFILCVMVTGIIFNNEYNNHTFKNCVSYGIPRGTIYFGKLIVQFVYAMITFIIIIGVHVGSAYLLLENSGPGIMDMLLQTCVADIPLLLFSLAAANCFYFIIEGTGGAVSAAVGLILAIPHIFNFLGMKFEFFRTVANVLPWNLLSNIKFNLESNSVQLFWEKNGNLYYWLAGMIQMSIIIAIGYLLFSKKEIK